MYAKIFTQIFDSSLAENYQHRHVFEDLLKLADKTGAVNMTQEAIARRTNCPLDIVADAIVALCQPDPRSQSKELEGRRLTLLDPARDWGWQIVNYLHYRSLQDEEARRATWRDSKARQRARKSPRSPRRSKPSPGEILAVQAEANGDTATADSIAAAPADRIEQERVDALPPGLR